MEEASRKYASPGGPVPALRDGYNSYGAPADDKGTDI